MTENNSNIAQLQIDITKINNMELKFVLLTSNNTRECLISLTNEGQFFSANRDLVLGDFKSLKVEGVEAVSTSTHPT